MPLTIFAQQHHAAASAPDTVPTQLTFDPPAFRLDMGIFDNAALVSYSFNGLNFTTEREFSAGIFLSMDAQIHVLRIRNKTAGSIARFDVTAFYDPVEIIGREYVRPE